MPGRTLYEKIWDEHVIAAPEGELDVALHRSAPRPRGDESPGLRGPSAERTRGSPPRPHPGDGRPQCADRSRSRRRSTDPISRRQLEVLDENCREFGITLFPRGHENQGIVHVIGPELGVTQPGMTIVCGDSHTSTHGAFGCLAFGIGTSEVEHVLATQTLPQQKAKTMAVRVEGIAAARRHARRTSCSRSLAVSARAAARAT